MIIKKLLTGIFPALPTAYDNTLSFYESVGKLTYKINEVIEALNNMIIPTKTSQLENDSGYITAAQASAVTSVNSQIGNVVLDAEDVGALPDDTVIPTKVSQLENDAGYVTSAQQGGVTSVNGETGIVTLDIPTKTSELTNDSGFITSAQVGGVTSVNGETGVVVLDASDVGALPDDTSIPSKTSDLTNDSGFITSSDIPVTSVNSKTGSVVLDASDVGALPSNTVIPVASNANPIMDSVANCGSSNDFARADHTHPSDTSKADASSVHSIPIGGTTGQVLAKNSGANFDVSWINPSGGGSGGSFTSLWDGNAPITAIGSHTVTITGLSGYDYLVVAHYNRIVGFMNYSIIIPSVPYGVMIGGCYDNSLTDPKCLGSRWYSISGDTISFDGGYSLLSSDMANNQCCIPCKIWGAK